MAKLHCNENLQRLTMSNCGIGDHYFAALLDLLSQHKSPINHLDVSQNELSAMSMKNFGNYLVNYQNSSELQTVILDKNSLFDEGIRGVIDGLIERFNNLEKQNHPQINFGKSSHNSHTTIAMPISTLSLSNVSMSETGFKHMIG